MAIGIAVAVMAYSQGVVPQANLPNNDLNAASDYDEKRYQNKSQQKN